MLLISQKSNSQFLGEIRVSVWPFVTDLLIFLCGRPGFDIRKLDAVCQILGEQCLRIISTVKS